MRSARVFVKNREAGRLQETDLGYVFTYLPDYYADSDTPPVSLTLPKRQNAFTSDTLFPFFFGMLAEGALKEIQCRKLQLDEADHFGRLIATAGPDTPGAVHLIPESS